MSDEVATSEPLCMCKDRALSKCPGEWEPGCDLGNNEKYMRVGFEQRIWSRLRVNNRSSRADCAAIAAQADAVVEALADALRNARLTTTEAGTNPLPDAPEPDSKES